MLPTKIIQSVVHEIKKKFDYRRFRTSLKRCNEYAELGYNRANASLSVLKEVIQSVTGEIQKSIAKLPAQQKNKDTLQMLEKQLSSICQELEGIPFRLDTELRDLKKRLATFSITLFGRTMAGKSTLMEILTKGNGQSIGMGAQRTTRDVRQYGWNDLTITDVPGIAAFEGVEDEKAAFDSAKQADLVLFLITDDAPQPAEAECLCKIRYRGKPVLGIINVKARIDNNLNDSNFNQNSLRQIDKAFDEARLNDIRTQFIEFGKKAGQDWESIPFVNVHLKAAFLSQRPQCVKHRWELFEKSRFESVEQFIEKDVSQRGKFYRIKTFLDTVGVAMFQAVDHLLKKIAESYQTGNIILEKQQELKVWTEKFKDKATQRIGTFVNQMSRRLNDDAVAFAEEHYDDKKAGTKWTAQLKQKHLEQQCETALKKLAEECQDKLKETQREIANEIKFVETLMSDISIGMPTIFDLRRTAGWTSVALSGIGTAIGLIFGLSNPVGWVFLGIGIILGLVSGLFGESKAMKIEKARQELQQKLFENIRELTSKIEAKMQHFLNDNILANMMYPAILSFDSVATVCFELSQAQKKLFQKLNKEFKDINKKIFLEALTYCCGRTKNKMLLNFYDDIDAARIPGTNLTLLVKNELCPIMPVKEQKKLETLLGEKISFIVGDHRPKQLLIQTIGKDVLSPDDIHIDNGVASISSIEMLNPDTVNRIKIAQQLTELLITK